MRKIINAAIGIAFLAATFTVWGAIQMWMGSHQPSALDSASISDEKLKGGAGRQLELGTAKDVGSGDKAEKQVIINDSEVAEKWGIANTNAVRAWKEVTQGSRDIVVAVIDTGLDINHKDIKANLWKNPGETGLDAKGRDKATNGIDDDKNGFIDDVHGWNFVHNNHNLTDNHGHGTHISGIIGAEGGNNFGISGISPRVSLMVLKYYDPKATGSNNLKNTVESIRYAIKMNAKIINYSGGGLEFSQDEFEAVKEAEKKGILFVAAAGNEKSNSDISKYYPADYGLSNIISVTAINPDLNVLPSSNYGIHTVDIAAPGENIYSALPNNTFGLMTGTSQATAFVSGVAALVMSHNREFSAFDVKKYILRTGDEHPSLRSKTGTAKKLNVFKALTTLDTDVNAVGAKVANTGSMDRRQFASDGKARGVVGGNEELRDTENIASFSKDMLKALEESAAAAEVPKRN